MLSNIVPQAGVRTLQISGWHCSLESTTSPRPPASRPVTASWTAARTCAPEGSRHRSCCTRYPSSSTPARDTRAHAGVERPPLLTSFSAGAAGASMIGWRRLAPGAPAQRTHRRHGAPGRCPDGGGGQLGGAEQGPGPEPAIGCCYVVESRPLSRACARGPLGKHRARRLAAFGRPAAARCRACRSASVAAVRGGARWQEAPVSESSGRTPPALTQGAPRTARTEPAGAPPHPPRRAPKGFAAPAGPPASAEHVAYQPVAAPASAGVAGCACPTQGSTNSTSSPILPEVGFLRGPGRSSRTWSRSALLLEAHRCPVQGSGRSALRVYPGGMADVTMHSA